MLREQLQKSLEELQEVLERYERLVNLSQGDSGERSSLQPRINSIKNAIEDVDEYLTGRIGQYESAFLRKRG